MLTPTWVPCLGAREDVGTQAGQGTLPRASWFRGTPPPLAGQSQSRWDNDITVMGTCSLPVPVGPGDARSQSCSTGWTQQV